MSLITFGLERVTVSTYIKILEVWSNLGSDLQMHTSFEYWASRIVWEIIGPTDNQGTKRVLREEMVVTGKAKWFFSLLLCSLWGTWRASHSRTLHYGDRQRICFKLKCVQKRYGTNKTNRKKMLESDDVHPTGLKGLKHELAEIIIVHGLLFKTGLELIIWK